MLTATNPLALTPEEMERARDVEELSTRGAAAVPQLIEGLSDPSWAVRRQVVAVLGALGEPAIPALCEVLRTRRDNENRLAAAVDALVASTADVFDALADLLDLPDPAILAEVAQVFGRRRMARAVPVLGFLIGHPDDNVAIAAIEALGRIGGRSVVPSLIEAVNSGNFFRVFPAIDVLGRSGDPRVIAPLTALMNGGTFSLEAARALGRTGEAAAVGPLAALLAQGTEMTVRVAALALAELLDRHRERYGDQEAPERALRATHPGTGARRRLVQSMASADEEEKEAIATVLGILGGEGAVVALRSLLDEDGGAARAAANALRRLGRESEAEVRSALRASNSARRQVLLPIITSARATPEVELCLSDPDPTVRVLTCDALARIGGVEAVPRLFELLADTNPRVVQAAIGAIQSLGSEQTTTLAMHAAVDARATVRRAALRILAYFGSNEAVPLFQQALGDPDARVRETALAGLPSFDDPAALESLLESVRDASPKVRSAAVRALGQTTRRDSRVAAYLLASIADEDAWVRYYGCQALGRLGLEHAADRIVRLLDDPAGQVRVAAIEALSHFRSPSAVAALRRAAEHDQDVDAQRAALIGLGISRGPESLPVLVHAAQSPDPSTRLVAVSALADSASPAALPVLVRAAHDRDESVRAAAVGFLAATPGLEATSALVDLIREGPTSEAERAANSLAVHSEGRVPGLLSALGTADDELAPVLAAALARMRLPDATEALLEALRSPSVAARKAAAAALASVGSPEAWQALRRAAQADPEFQVRQVCAILLAD